MTTLGIVFPGQGSQSVGMLADIARQFPEVEMTFAEASAVLGYDLWKITQEGPASELDKTVCTQPAILTASYAIWRILERAGTVPTLLAGHSLGEYTALVCARSLAFTDAVHLVAARGEFMQDAVPEGQGALAAIVGLDDASVKQLCEQAAEDQILAPVNFNSPGQVVIGGQKEAVERALTLAKEAGAKLAKLLPVSVPSHCSLMKPAAERFAKLLDTIIVRNPLLPVVSNVDVKAYETGASIKEGLTRQLFMPVRWVETIQLFAELGVQEIIECGPGKVLSGLNKRIVTDIKLANTADLSQLQNLLKIN